MVDLSVSLAGHRLSNPVMTAAGCAGHGRELNRFLDVAALGAMVTASVTAEARAGSDAPRMLETPAGLVADTGLANPGAAALLRDLRWLHSVGATVIVSIAGSTSAEYARVADLLRTSEDFGAVMGLEVNLSVPNASAAGRSFDDDALSAATVVGRVREQLPRRTALFAKLAVDAGDLVGVAAACLEAGADGLTLGNGPRGMTIHVDSPTRRPLSVVGRVSGAAARPMAALAVQRVHQAMLAGRMSSAPIIGVGGVASGRDALELLLAGATAVQVGSATLADPRAPARVRDDLARLLDSWGCASLGDERAGVMQSPVARREPAAGGAPMTNDQ